jgi:NitT/TauT family transport system permease protein
MSVSEAMPVGALPSGVVELARRVIRTAAVVGAVVGIWAGLIALFDLPPYQVPSPAQAFRALVDERVFLLESLRVTMVATFAGLAFSATVSIVLAATFVAFPVTERAFLPVAIIFRSIPIVAMAPLLTLFVGRGLKTAVVCVTVVTFFPILVNAAKGFRSVSTGVHELFAITGASRWQLFKHARLPTALPFLFAGLRVAGSVGVLAAMTAEWLTGTEGLGFLLLRASSRRQSGLLWAGVIVATLAALTIFTLASMADKRLQRRFPQGRPT